jgi:PAS domain S-box-containing protein
MVGRPHEELINKSMHELFPPELAANIIADDMEVLNSGKEKMVEEEELGGRYYTSIKFPISIKGKPTFLAGYTIDITDRKLAEKALRQSEEQLKFALSGTNDGIWDVNLQDGTVYLSPRGCEILGYNPDFIKDKFKTWQPLVHPDDMQQTNEALEAYLKGEQPIFIVEQRLQTSEGNWKWILTRGKAVSYDSDGKALRMVGTHTDISERKIAEEAVQKLNADLEQRVAARTSQLELANKELEAFSYSVSHDLRAPLRHINGFINLFLEEKQTQLSEQELSYLKTVTDSVNDMGKLIDALLSFSRLNRAELRKSTLETEKLIRQNIILFENEIKTRQIEITIHPLHKTLADYQLISQVWVNLLSNAIKYTGKKEKPFIEIGSYAEKDKTVFFIKDNGAGFNMKYSQKLFGVFQRLHKPRDFEGIGIGLANINRIILRHGGQCWAEGEPDKGATFFFSLPSSENDS